MGHDGVASEDCRGRKEEAWGGQVGDLHEGELQHPLPILQRRAGEGGRITNMNITDFACVRLCVCDYVRACVCARVCDCVCVCV